MSPRGFTTSWRRPARVRTSGGRRRSSTGSGSARHTCSRTTTWWRSSRPRSGSPLPDPHVEADGCEQDRAHRDLLVERVEAVEHITVADERDEEDTDDRPPDGAFTAEDARATDDDPRQYRERERRVTRSGLCAHDARRVDDTGEPGGRTAEHE